MRAASLYTGDRGRRYYSQREALRSAEVQRERAALFFDVADERATVLDFGCGNGLLLAELAAARRIGVEISPEATKEAEKALDMVVADIDSVADASVDVAISFHALEHVESPASVIRAIRRVLKPNGIMKLIVPCEAPLLSPSGRHWHPNDIAMHLYTWSPLSLGNLVSVCGFTVEDARLLPDSAGGRLGRRLEPSSAVRRWLAWRKAIVSGRLHAAVTARKSDA